jgi:hypothetical protein
MTMRFRRASALDGSPRSVRLSSAMRLLVEPATNDTPVKHPEALQRQPGARQYVAAEAPKRGAARCLPHRTVREHSRHIHHQTSKAAISMIHP